MEANTVTYNDYRVGTLFEIKPTKTCKLSGNAGKTPVLSNTSYNNGIKYYAEENPTEEGHIITFSDTTDSALTVFYQKEPFIGYSHVQGMRPTGEYKDRWTEKSLLYFIGAFRAVIGKEYNYGNKFNRTIAANTYVPLPCNKEGKLDFTYMEEYIQRIEQELILELETDHIRNKEGYLSVTGIEDYTLSEQDKEKVQKLLQKTDITKTQLLRLVAEIHKE